MNKKVDIEEMSIDELIAYGKKLSEEFPKKHSTKFLSALYKYIQVTKQWQKIIQQEIKLKREISRLEQQIRRQRTHKLIQLGAEYYKVFQSNDVESAKAKFEEMKKMQDNKESASKQGS